MRKGRRPSWPTGRCSFSAAGTSAEYAYDPPATAMWIALRRSDGDCRAAARILAQAWETSLERTLADMEAWLRELCAAGLVDVEC
jgi:hypothetical protein